MWRDLQVKTTGQDQYSGWPVHDEHQDELYAPLKEEEQQQL